MTFFKYSVFRKRVVITNLKKSSSNTIFKWYTFGKFHKFYQRLSNSVIFVKDQIKWIRGFELFLIDQCAGDIGNKNMAGKY